MPNLRPRCANRWVAPGAGAAGAGGVGVGDVEAQGLRASANEFGPIGKGAWGPGGTPSQFGSEVWRLCHASAKLPT